MTHEPTTEPHGNINGYAWLTPPEIPGTIVNDRYHISQRTTEPNGGEDVLQIVDHRPERDDVSHIEYNYHRHPDHTVGTLEVVVEHRHDMDGQCDHIGPKHADVPDEVTDILTTYVDIMYLDGGDN